MANILSILFILLLLLGCGKDQQTRQTAEGKTEQTEKPSPEPGFKINDSSRKEIIKRDSSIKEIAKEFEAMLKAGREPFSNEKFLEKFRATYVAESEEGKKKLWNAVDKIRYKIIEEEHRKKLETEYAKKFKKPAPQWEDNSFIGPSNPLERAIRLNFPYLTKEEGIKLKSEDEKIISEYKKEFGADITDVLSIARVDFRKAGVNRIIAARTASGIFAKYEYEPGGANSQMELKLDMGEWLDFITALYTCGINERPFNIDDERHEKRSYTYMDILYNTPPWLKIYSLDNEMLINIIQTQPNSKDYSEMYLPYWKEVKKVMDDMEAKIKKRGKKAGR